MSDERAPRAGGHEHVMAPVEPMIVPPDQVIEIWNRVAEDSGTLEATILRFSRLLLIEAQQRPADVPVEAA